MAESYTYYSGGSRYDVFTRYGRLVVEKTTWGPADFLGHARNFGLHPIWMTPG
jgi:hypothetical protein